MINGLPLAGLLSNPAPCSLLGLARSLAASSSVWQCLHSAVGPTSSAVAAASPVAGRAFSTAAAAAQSGRPAAAAAASVPVERLQRIITPQLCDSLRRNGFAVVDNVFGPETAAALREELAAVRGTEAMHKNCTHLVHNGATGLLEKEHIWEAELMLPDTQALAPRCAQLQNDSTLRVMLSLFMPELSLQSQAIKLQWNAGQGGCFPMHFDSDMALDMRRVTAVWYLNPDWKPEDGGQLRVYPFPQDSVDIAPLNDRMVLFSSMHLLHRVLPSAAERYCFTIWISAAPLQPLLRPTMAAADAQAALAALGDVNSLEPDSELFKSDAFRMGCMKVLPCSRRYVHDWTECPFAHPQEKARRRDPSVHNYTGIACPSMKKEGCCAFGDHCPYAHNVFEYWLHPTRYRTQLCNDGSNCKRKICFFAHSLDELRVPACKPFVSPEALASAAASAAADAEAKRRAATVGSPLAAFAALSPGPSPQRASLGSLPAARLSGASMAGPASPSTTDDALMGSSPADAGVQAALQQLAGAGFSSQEHQVIELVTSLLAQDKVSPEQAANILQQMLAPNSLNQLQAHLNTPRASMDEMRVCYSDPLAGRGMAAGPAGAELQMRASSSFDMGSASPRAAVMAQQAQQAQQAHSAPQGLSLEHLAAMQAAQTMGFAGLSLQQGPQPAHHSFAEYQANPRMSLESARSSFDTARMSFDTSGRPSMEAGRGSVDAVYPPQLVQTLSGQGFYGAQLSSVPEQFPMINAPPPNSSWSMGAAGRFSLDSAADRLSEDMSRLSFEAAARPLAAPTANPYASAFFMAGAPPASEAPQPSELRMSAPAGLGGMERRLPPLRTGSNKSASPDPPTEEAAGQLLGGTALHRLQ